MDFWFDWFLSMILFFQNVLKSEHADLLKKDKTNILKLASKCEH